MLLCLCKWGLQVVSNPVVVVVTGVASVVTSAVASGIAQGIVIVVVGSPVRCVSDGSCITGGVHTCIGV